MAPFKNNEIDPNLKQLLRTYAKTAPQRNPEAEKRTRENFSAELDKMFLGAPASSLSSRKLQSISVLWTSGIYQIKEYFTMTFAQRSTRTILTSILVLVVFLFGGTGITAYAASAALPGDALYPVKTSMENARISLAGDDAAQARLYLDLAGRRLAEIQSLIQDGRTSLVAEVAGQFEDDVQKAQNAIENLAKTDSTKAAALNTEASTILNEYGDTLSAMLAAAPAEIHSAIEEAILASQSDTFPENNNGNANSNGNINSNSNENENENSNSNANGNGNINSDDDANGNSNDNGNINSDDNSDINANGNGNINSDDDTDGNSNTNTGISGNSEEKDKNDDSSSSSSIDKSDDSGSTHSDDSNDTHSDDSSSGNGGNSNGDD